MTLRQDVSKIIGHTVTRDGFSQTFHRLQSEGRIGPKQMTELLILLLEREEMREDEAKIHKTV